MPHILDRIPGLPGVISAIAGKDDLIFCDRDNHASIIDGTRLSFAKTIKYQHNDMGDLAEKLEAAPTNRGKLIVADGIFSMLGDIVKLPDMHRLAKRFGARILLDDAHAFGVLGLNGRGTAEHHGLEKETDLVMGTFSKSLASIGGFVAGDREVIDFLKHKARSLIFSASLPPASAAGVIAALTVLEREPERRARLWVNANKMRASLRALGLDTGDSETPVVPVILGDQEYTFRFWRQLFERGVFANPVCSPAVPAGMDLLRTSYMATHTDQQLAFVRDQFAAVLEQMGAPPRTLATQRAAIPRAPDRSANWPAAFASELLLPGGSARSFFMSALSGNIETPFCQVSTALSDFPCCWYMLPRNR